MGVQAVSTSLAWHPASMPVAGLSTPCIVFSTVLSWWQVASDHCEPIPHGSILVQQQISMIQVFQAREKLLEGK